jgi:hypothetical protein
MVFTIMYLEKHVSRLYNVAPILLLQCLIYVILLYMINFMYFHFSTFRSMRTVPSMTVFCSSLMLCCQVYCLDIV